MHCVRLGDKPAFVARVDNPWSPLKPGTETRVIDGVRCTNVGEGVFMPGKPRVGQSFRQEFLKDTPRIHFQIIGIKGTRMANVLGHKVYERSGAVSMRHG